MRTHGKRFKRNGRRARCAGVRQDFPPPVYGGVPAEDRSRGVSRSASASRATYAGSAPIGTRTRTPATLTSTCVAPEGDGLTVTRTRRTSETGVLHLPFATSRSRRSLYSQYWKMAKPTPASAEKSLRDLPLPSNRATNSVQDRRRSARCFMRASFPHRRPPPKGAPSRTVTYKARSWSASIRSRGHGKNWTADDCRERLPEPSAQYRGLRWSDLGPHHFLRWAPHPSTPTF